MPPQEEVQLTRQVQDELAKIGKSEGDKIGDFTYTPGGSLVRYAKAPAASTGTPPVGGTPPAGTPAGTGGTTPPTGGATPPPVTRYTGTPKKDPMAEAYGAGGIFGDRSLPTADEEAKIRETERMHVQAQIDAINESAMVELANINARATQADGRTRARLNATGQIGGGNEGRAFADTAEPFNRERAAAEALKSERIAGILSGVESRSKDLIQKEKTSAKENSEKYLTYLQGVSEQARKDMTALATTGADLSPDKKQALLDQTGYDEETFDTLYNSVKIANSQGEYLNKDKPQIVGDKAIFFKQVKNADGSMSIVTEELALPPEAAEKKVQGTVNTAEGVMLLYEDGTYQKIGDVYQAPLRTSPTELAKNKKEADAEASAKESAKKDAETISSLATELLTLEGKGGAVGAGFQKFLRGIPFVPGEGPAEGTKAAGYVAKYNQLKDMLALPNLSKLKGAMSDKDIAFLRNIGTSLNTSTSEDQFDKELNKIISHQFEVIEGGGDTPGGGGMVRMTGPQGEFEVPQDQIATFKQNGYVEL
jgi:hypothetical protein